MSRLVQRQRLAAYGLLTDGPRVLLAHSSQRAAVPDRWWLPGGGVEFGEEPRACVVREFEEETGLSVAVGDLIDVASDVMDLPELDEPVHTVRLIYDVTLRGGSLRAETDGTTDAVEWFPLADAMTLPLTCACNLGPLCRRHHRIKQLGWVKHRRADGSIRWTSPTGRS